MCLIYLTFPQEYPKMTLTTTNILISLGSVAASWLLPCVSVYLCMSFETNIYHNDCTHMVSTQYEYPDVLYNSCIGIMSSHFAASAFHQASFLFHRGYTDMSYHQSVFSMIYLIHFQSIITLFHGFPCVFLNYFHHWKSWYYMY